MPNFAGYYLSRSPLDTVRYKHLQYVYVCTINDIMSEGDGTGEFYGVMTFRRGLWTMPFNSSYKDFDKLRYADSREYFAGLAKYIVKEPLSTHIIKTASASGKTRYLVVNRAALPEEGDMAMVCTDHGLRVGRLKRAVSLKDIWGKVIWVIQEG
jgi:hypothetical protein